MNDRVYFAKPVAEKIKTEVQQAVSARLERGQVAPGLAVILVGDDPASHAYVGHKQKGCESVGIISSCFHLPAHSKETEIAERIEACNRDPNIHGILLQLPLPPGINSDNLLELIDPKKDVDGFHPYNMGRLAQRRPLLRPCTPWGVIQLLNAANIDLAGKSAVVVGASNIVGRPMALELLLAKCTVTVCHRFTRDLAEQVAHADILVVGIGNPNIIQSKWIKPGAVVIDVGFNRLEDGRIVGDIDFATAKERASLITPVPGGVGLMTVAMLLANTLEAANRLDPVL
jgi:methylenetetrahydrofolate dehydrogenase (NADP+)/methenyltetrahydrofolate cyclohydrolase